MPSATSSSIRSKKQFSLGQACARLTLVAGVLSFITSLLSASFSASALTAPILDGLQNAAVPGWGVGARTSIGLIVANIILVVLGLLGVVFVVLLTYGGFLWLSAAGEEDKVKKAQGIIFNSLIGVLIVIAAYSIAYYVLTKLVIAIQ